MIEIKAFKSEDGKIFESELECVKYELKDLYQKLQSREQIGAEDALEPIINNVNQFLPLLNKLTAPAVLAEIERESSKSKGQVA